MPVYFLRKSLAIVIVILGGSVPIPVGADTVPGGMAPETAPLFRLPIGHDHPPEQLLYSAAGDQVENVEIKNERGKEFHDRSIGEVATPTVSVHQPPADRRTPTAVVVCPGGGYRVNCIDKEGHDTARWLNSLGITAIVLKYRCGDHAQQGQPREDALAAIRWVRDRAESLAILPDRVGILGYSAGGHLASTAATHFDRLAQRDRPDFAILIYPVISMDDAITHQGSRRNLLGQSPSPEQLRQFSNETRVTPDCPPTFLVHALDDHGVLLENSLRFYRALERHRVPAELMVLQHGGHGFGLGVNGGEPQRWPARCSAWLRRLGLLES